MKIMSRDFSLMEKILLVILVVVLLGLVYYRFVYQTVNDSIRTSEAEAQSIRTELDVVEQKIAHLQTIQTAMDELEQEGNMSYMGSYNHSKEEVRFLNDILAYTLQYSISFADVTRVGDQIRRSFTLQFQTRNYRQAQKIIVRLNNGKDRCIIGDVRCAIAEDNKVTINASATFFETMVGGTPDAALPQDTAETNS